MGADSIGENTTEAGGGGVTQDRLHLGLEDFSGGGIGLFEKGV